MWNEKHKRWLIILKNAAALRANPPPPPDYITTPPPLTSSLLLPSSQSAPSDPHPLPTPASSLLKQDSQPFGSYVSHRCFSVAAGIELENRTMIITRSNKNKPQSLQLRLCFPSCPSKIATLEWFARTTPELRYAHQSERSCLQCTLQIIVGCCTLDSPLLCSPVYGCAGGICLVLQAVRQWVCLICPGDKARGAQRCTVAAVTENNTKWHSGGSGASVCRLSVNLIKRDVAKVSWLGDVLLLLFETLVYCNPEAHLSDSQINGSYCCVGCLAYMSGQVHVFLNSKHDLEK